MRPVLLWCFRPGTCKLTLPAPADQRLLPRAPRNRKRQASRSHRSPRLACRVSPPLLRPPSSQPHGPKPGTVSRVSLDRDRPARPHLPHRGQRPLETRAGRPDPAHPAVAPTAPGQVQPRAGRHCRHRCPQLLLVALGPLCLCALSLLAHAEPTPSLGLPCVPNLGKKPRLGTRPSSLRVHHTGF